MNTILCVKDEFVLRAFSQDLKNEFANDFLIELAQSPDDTLLKTIFTKLWDLKELITLIKKELENIYE